MKLTAKQKLQVAKNVAVEIPLEILQFLIVPIALLACDEKSENLPKWASWFDDPDYGVNGDDGGRANTSRTAQTARTLRAFAGYTATA